MKAFIFSSIAIVALLIFSSIYSVYICGIIDDMITLANTLPQSKDDFSQGHVDNIERIKMLWEKHSTIFQLFTDDHHHTAAELALSRLEDYTNTDNFDDFLFAKSNFLTSLEDIKLIEGRGFFSIF